VCDQVLELQNAMQVQAQTKQPPQQVAAPAPVASQDPAIVTSATALTNPKISPLTVQSNTPGSGNTNGYVSSPDPAQDSFKLSDEDDTAAAVPSATSRTYDFGEDQEGYQAQEKDVNGFEEDSEDEDNANAASAAAAAVPGIYLIESTVVLLRSYQYSFGAHLAALFRLD